MSHAARDLGEQARQEYLGRHKTKMTNRKRAKNKHRGSSDVLGGLLGPSNLCADGGNGPITGGAWPFCEAMLRLVERMWR